MKKPRGQVLIGVVILMSAVLILVPFLIQYARNEAKSSTKTHKNTEAFHLAELALERGYQQLILTTSTWVTVSSGGVIAGYNFDTTYDDPSGGQYQVRLSSGVGNTVWVTSVGRSADGKEVRGISAQYVGGADLTNSIYSGGAVACNASTDVEWGPIISHVTVTTGGRTYPRYYATGNVSPQDANGASPPNTDNVQWWSWQTNLPAMPTIDLAYYRNEAQTAGAAPSGCGGNFYSGNKTIKGCNGGALTAGTWYSTGDIVFKAGSGGNQLSGVIIALGNVEIQGTGGSSRNMTVPVPPEAWKEYGNNWGHYQSFDAGAPASYAAAAAGNYTSSANYNINNILVEGLIYAGGNIQCTGSGNSAVYGVMIVQAEPSLGSNFTLYYNPTVSTTVHAGDTVPQRAAWKDVSCSWTSGAAVCQ